MRVRLEFLGSKTLFAGFVAANIFFIVVASFCCCFLWRILLDTHPTPRNDVCFCHTLNIMTPGQSCDPLNHLTSVIFFKKQRLSLNSLTDATFLELYAKVEGFFFHLFLFF